MSQFLIWSFIGDLLGFTAGPHPPHCLFVPMYHLDDLPSLLNRSRSESPPVLQAPGGVFHNVPGSPFAARLPDDSPYEC